MEHWPAALHCEVGRRDGRQVLAVASLQLERPADAMTLWLRLAAAGDDNLSSVWELDEPAVTQVSGNCSANG